MQIVSYDGTAETVPASIVPASVVTASIVTASVVTASVVTASVVTASVTALGFFDGVHIGHRALLSEARRQADARALPLWVFTFPAEGEAKPGAVRLYNTAEKLSLLEECGVDGVLLADFSAVRDLSPEGFVRRVLLSALGTKVAVCGKNFRFGKGAAGGPACLSSLLKSAGGCTAIVDDVLYRGAPISSTRVRAFLGNGDLSAAREALGAPYFLFGRVERGNGVGRTLDFPTVNLPLPEKFPLPPGVYRAAVKLGGKYYHAITNVGVCPTFSPRPLHAETHLLGFSGDLYGEDVRVEFLGFLRGEEVFSDAGALKAQIAKDALRAREENEREGYYSYV